MKYYRQAKIDIAIHERKQTEYKHTQSRFEARNERLDRIDDRFDKKKTISNEEDQLKDTLEDKRSYIQAAVKRMKQKRNKK